VTIRRVGVLGVVRVTGAESRRSQNDGPSPFRLAQWERPEGDALLVHVVDALARVTSTGQSTSETSG
jgi:hypothetical protein